MASRHPSELTIPTCRHCQREFIQMRIGQAYCRRPECQRAYEASMNRQRLSNLAGYKERNEAATLERANSVLEFIIDYKSQNGKLPSYSQIGAEIGVDSTGSIYTLLGLLEKAGKIIKPGGSYKNLVIVEEAL